jgi:hypothetical protein
MARRDEPGRGTDLELQVRLEWPAKFTLLYRRRLADRMDHQGHRARRRTRPQKGESCADCHAEEAADMSARRSSAARRTSPSPSGKAGFINVSVQAAHDGEQLYLRFSWQQPKASGGSDGCRQRRQDRLHAGRQQGELRRT